MGDSILFYFEDVKSAVKASKEIAKCFDRSVEGFDVRFNVSIATGDVCLTKVGHPNFLFDDIMGITVSKAAILLREANKRDDGIALCPETEKIVNLK